LDCYVPHVWLSLMQTTTDVLETRMTFISDCFGVKRFHLSSSYHCAETEVCRQFSNPQIDVEHHLRL